MKRRRKQQIFTITHYKMIDGKQVLFDPLKSDLPDRCKLVFTELTTGNKYRIVSGS